MADQVEQGSPTGAVRVVAPATAGDAASGGGSAAQAQLPLILQAGALAAIHDALRALLDSPGNPAFVSAAIAARDRGLAEAGFPTQSPAAAVEERDARGGGLLRLAGFLFPGKGSLGREALGDRAGAVGLLSPVVQIGGKQPVFFKGRHPGDGFLALDLVAVAQDESPRKLTLLARFRDRAGNPLPSLDPEAAASKLFPDCGMYKLSSRDGEPFSFTLPIRPDASTIELGFATLSQPERFAIMILRARPGLATPILQPVVQAAALDRQPAARPAPMREAAAKPFVFRLPAWQVGGDASSVTIAERARLVDLSLAPHFAEAVLDGFDLPSRLVLTLAGRSVTLVGRLGVLPEGAGEFADTTSVETGPVEAGDALAPAKAPETAVEIVEIGDAEEFDDDDDVNNDEDVGGEEAQSGHGRVSAPSRMIYAGAFAEQAPGQALALFAPGRPPLESFDLRLGDRAGPRPSALPESLIVGRAPEWLVSEPQMRQMTWQGFAAHTGAPPGSVSIVLRETKPGISDDHDPEPVPITIDVGQSFARQPSADGEAMTGVKTSGYAIRLPAEFLDGARHDLSLVAESGDLRRELWSGVLVADEDFLAAQISHCEKPVELRRLLVGYAIARRTDFIDRYVSNPDSFSPIVLGPADLFEILAYLVLHGEEGEAPARLRARFTELWREAAESGRDRTDFVRLALSVLTRFDDAGSPGRYPHAPLAEAALDLVLTTPWDKAKTDVLADLAAFALNSRRPALARRILAAAPKTNSDATLLLRAVSAELALGDYGAAEAYAMRILKVKPRWSEGLNALARVYARQGKALHAAATVSGGRGLSHWLAQPPSYEQAKLFAQLDWPGLMERAAVQARKPDLTQAIACAHIVLGSPQTPEATGYSVAILDPGETSLAEIFDALASSGCRQVIDGRESGMSELECIGGFALVLRKPRALPPELVSAIFAQRRAFEPVVKLVTASIDQAGVPKAFALEGMLAHVQALRTFGPCTLDEFVARADRGLRVKTVLI